MNAPSNTGPATGDLPSRRYEASPTEITGQVAVVTGASRGIGRGIAIRLGNLGASVVVNYSRDSSGAADTVATIEAVGARALAVQADVSKPDEVATLLAKARTHFGGLDIVVANAGIDETGGPLLEVTEAAYDRMTGVNTKGAFFTLQHAARAVTDGGSIIFIGSGSTKRPVAGFGLYASSKLAASYLVGLLAQEIGGRGVTVNEVAASATDGAGYFSLTTKTARSARSCRTPAPAARGWAPQTTSPTPSSSSPANSPVRSADNN